MPDTRAGLRLWRDPQPESAAKLKRYGAQLLSILEEPLPMTPGKSNELAPRSIFLSPKARRLLIQFGDHVERCLAKGAAFEPIRPLGNKLAEHATRLAAVLTLTENLHAPSAPPRCAEAGIRLAEHYAAEALRLAQPEGAAPDLELAERLRLWLLAGWKHSPTISITDIYNYGPNPIRNARTARRIVGILQEYGWLIRMQRGAVVLGKFRRECWQIITGGLSDGRLRSLHSAFRRARRPIE